MHILLLLLLLVSLLVSLLQIDAYSSSYISKHDCRMRSIRANRLYNSKSNINGDITVSNDVPKSYVSAYKSKAMQALKSINALVASTATVAIATSYPTVTRAVSGSVQKSTAEETKKAVMDIKKALDGMTTAENLSKDKKYNELGILLSDRIYTEFDAIANVLVRSDLISSEDKIALGTIKRYGIVADAIIMIGGLTGALAAGGIKITSSSGSSSSSSSIQLQKSIEEEDDDDEDDDGAGDDDKVKKVDDREVTKYIKLSKDSLNDIYRIVSPILSK